MMYLNPASWARKIGRSTLLALVMTFAIAPVAAEETTITVPTQNPDYTSLFKELDASINNGNAFSMVDNTTSALAWAQSYFQMAYLQMYYATSDTLWLDKLTTQFDQVLTKRDDRMGKIDMYAKEPLKGWGGSQYDEGQWHVYVVHTGMICKAPSEFVRLVKSDPALGGKYGAHADRYLAELEEIVADADRYFVTSGTMGYYTDGSMKGSVGGMVPLNMSNAMGAVIVELYRITDKAKYKEQATKLATYFRESMHEDPKSENLWVWDYWPKYPGEPLKTGEDISHAAVNVDFAKRCFEAGIVFTQEDMDRIARTWITNVDQGDKFADFISGERPNNTYIPQAAGRWLTLHSVISPELREPLLRSVQRAFSGAVIEFPSKGLGLAHLARYSK